MEEGGGGLVEIKMYNVAFLFYDRYVDFLNVMSYDFHGPWKHTLGHSSPLKKRVDQQGDSLFLNTVGVVCIVY